MANKNYTESWLDTYKKYLGSINFTAGDFDSLKSVIRDYVVRHNPEGYNDWQESSEVGMFVNAVAYLGENINYRVDLNVNDLFPSTTTRKQSLLNFVKMLSYNSKRNRCANGLAKLVSVSTTQDITDSSGTLLQGVTINWDDKTNEDWLEQFLTIMNSAFTYTNQFGKPTKNVPINNISNQIYQFNSAINSNATYSFSAKINGSHQNFEVVNPDIDVDTSSVVEMTPIPERMFQILYRNDGAGNSSRDTGFFVYWKQGTLSSEILNFSEQIENNTITIDKDNINNEDVWFEELNKNNGYVSKVWTKLPANELLSYTNTPNNVRTIYKVETEENDRITLKFPDGYFGDIPFGIYRVWYRVSNGNSGLYIKPSDISKVSIRIPYFNNASNEENIYYLTLTFSVVDVSHIRQAVPTESLETIKENAPDVYSTQDRMVSAKDYNYFPKTIGQSLRVLNAIERTYAGNSRFIDLNDPTGSYADVNVLATDGYMYSKNDYIKSTVANNVTPDIIYDTYIDDKLSMKEISNLYYQNYDGVMIPMTSDDSQFYWNPTFIDGMNTMSGYFTIGIGQNKVSYSEIDNNINVGDLLCFQEYKVEDGEHIDTTNYVWARVEDFTFDDKRNETILKISEVLDTNKSWKIRKYAEETKLWSKYYAFNTTIDSDIKQEIVKRMTSASDQTSFGITYVSDMGDSETHYGKWIIIDKDDDINGYLEDDEVSMVSYDNEYINSTYKVLNWFFRINYSANSWTIDTHRNRTIFGSASETSFFFNTSKKQNNTNGYFTTDDVIKITKENNGLDLDYYWKPYDVIRYSDGYVDPQEFCCEAYDSDKDSVMDNPNQYNDMIKNTKDIIFLNSDNDSLDEKVFLDYIDLYSIYNENGMERDESFKCSLWEKTLTSGYYYTYHRIKEVIGAGRVSTQMDENGKQKTSFYLPQQNNVILSNGYVESFSGKEITIDENNTLTYDFVDYYDGYDETTYNMKFYDDLDKNGNQIHGYLYKYDAESKKLTEIKNYEKVNGVSGLTFLWKHKATEDYIIDPCSTNIIDMYVLTNEYYEKVQTWVQNGKKDIFPKAPSAYELKGVFSTLESNKMISDTMVWHPVTYKLVFGQNAETDTHCIFKVIKRNDLISDNEIKKNVISLIDTYFKNMGVGETFYFTKLTTYIQNKIPELINTILIVPTDTTNKFGNLFQIKCEDNEILLSSATLDDVQIITTITEQNIRAI